MNAWPATESADARAKTAPSRVPRPSLVLFPFYRDRLACDPHNSLCVYGSYEFKWGDIAKESEENIRALVDAMILAARRAFTDSLTYWRQIPATVRRALALRSVLGSCPTALLASISQAQPSLHHSLSSVAVGSETQTSVLLASQRMSVVNRLSAPTEDVSSPRDSASRQQQSSVLGTSHSRAPVRSLLRERQEEDAANNPVVGLWDSPQNKPRCRLVIDIVASRKTLGEDPQKSEPYRLGQQIYRYVQEQYSTDGMTVFVGISDSAMTLVGRDILFPYRTAGGGASTAASGRVGRLRNVGPTAAAATAESLLASMVVGGSYPIAHLEHALANVIPPPSAVTAPATKTEKVDNIRLLVCYPSLGEVMA